MSKLNEQPQSPADGEPKAPRPVHGFAVPPFLHVFVLFMTQFSVTLFLVIPVQWLHERGMNSALLAVGAIATLVGIYFLIAFIGKLIPARCKYCRSPSHYRGLGWWPFTYRYDCKHCGKEMGFEVKG